MNYLTTLHRLKLSCITTGTAILLASGVSFGQSAPVPPVPPNLGTTSTYAAFSGTGAIGSTGLTRLTGDVGTNAGAFTGFPPGQYSGAKHVADAQSLTAKNDLIIAWNQAALIPCDTTLGVTMGNGQVLIPRTYCVPAASTLTGNMTFDAKGDPNAIFVVKIGGALNAAVGVRIILANRAQAVNIYWRIDGAVGIADNSAFAGTIIANGAIRLYSGATLDGRALALVGSVTMASNIMAVPVNGGGGPGNSLVVLKPAMGDSIRGGTQNYQITWAGTGIDAKKTFDYSLDNGATWKRIGEITANVFTYTWNVPDTFSTMAIVSITDKNNLSGKSGVFKITRNKPAPGNIVVVKPAAGDVIDGKTQNYQITWTGTGITPKKTLDYSLDGGATWKLIGTLNSDALVYSWYVPDTASARAMVSITDDNGVVGKSGLFTIKSTKPNPGAIIVVHPAAGEVIAGGTQNYEITWTGSNIVGAKLLEYSLDGGTTWSLIGVLMEDELTYTWADVPNEATTQGLVRVTDANSVSGTSGLFTITKTAGVGSISSLTLTGLDDRMNIGNDRMLGIEWAFTPDIGTSVDVDYSLDYGLSWVRIATVPTSGTPSTSWMTMATGQYYPVVVRVTSTKGMTRTSEPFSIGASVAGVPDGQKTYGYSLTSYPSPVSAETHISFVLPAEGDVTLAISDGLGREVASVVSGHFDAGAHTVPFDASGLIGGMYYYTLSAGPIVLVGKMIIVR